MKSFAEASNNSDFDETTQQLQTIDNEKYVKNNMATSDNDEI